MTENEHITEGCTRLWVAVMRKTADDLSFLAAAKRGDIDARGHAKQLREIVAEDPAEFLEGPWFEVICDLLGLDPGVTKRYFGFDAESIRSDGRLEDARSRRAA
jgi:hypothetical protein